MCQILFYFDLTVVRMFQLNVCRQKIKWSPKLQYLIQKPVKVLLPGLVLFSEIILSIQENLDIAHRTNITSFGRTYYIVD